MVADGDAAGTELGVRPTRPPFWWRAKRNSEVEGYHVAERGKHTREQRSAQMALFLEVSLDPGGGSTIRNTSATTAMMYAGGMRKRGRRPPSTEQES